VSIGSEKRHLPLHVTAIRTMCVRFDELSDREAIGGVVKNGVFAH
jgi:hypothetical protein